MGEVKDKTRGLKPGSKITSEPVRDVYAIQTITQLLSDNSRNQLLWIMGVNNGLRASDLVRIKVAQVEDLKVGDHIKVIESKTGKENVLVLNKMTHKALARYLNEVDPDRDSYLFSSRKGNGHISSQTVGKMVKAWCQAINLKGMYGAHTLRKTWGYHQRVTYGVGFELICTRYNHSNPSVTMRYLGIESKDVVNILMNGIGA